MDLVKSQTPTSRGWYPERMLRSRVSFCLPWGPVSSLEVSCRHATAWLSSV